MLNLILALILVVMLFTLAVLAVSMVKKCSAKDATIAVRDFLLEISGGLFKSKPLPQMFYPTLVGYDGNRILPQFVNTEFDAMRKNFQICYLVNYELSADNTYVRYYFDILRKPDAPADEEILPLLQKQAEEVLTSTLRLYDCYMPAEPLTVVELYPNALYVTFARNDTGIQYIDDIKRKKYKRMALSVQRPYTSMQENWHNGDGKS